MLYFEEEEEEQQHLKVIIHKSFLNLCVKQTKQREMLSECHLWKRYLQPPRLYGRRHQEGRGTISCMIDYSCQWRKARRQKYEARKTTDYTTQHVPTMSRGQNKTEIRIIIIWRKHNTAGRANKKQNKHAVMTKRETTKQLSTRRKILGDTLILSSTRKEIGAEIFSRGF